MSVRRLVAYRARFRPSRCMAVVLLAFCSGSLAANWQATLSKEPPGDFPELRPLRVSYVFGWSGITAATADVHFGKSAENRFQLEGAAHTVGFVRALWRFDLNYHALADANTLRP